MAVLDLKNRVVAATAHASALEGRFLDILAYAGSRDGGIIHATWL
jgi:hypothetical protein